MSGAGKEEQHGDGRALCSVCHSWRGSCLTATTAQGAGERENKEEIRWS